MLLLKFSIALLVAIPSLTFARDRERGFNPGRGGRETGNERSERPIRVDVGRAKAGGNGCPAGTVRMVFAPDNLSFSLIFDQFVASAQSRPGERRDVMSCDLLVPIQIPYFMQMEITRVDYRGFVGLPEKARARLHALYNFRGAGGDGDRMNLVYNFKGPVLDNYTLSSLVASSGNPNGNTEISPCGGKTVLRIFNQLTVVSPTPSAEAQVTIDSIDGRSNAIYYVNWRKCHR